jgi:hypothetical protein
VRIMIFDRNFPFRMQNAMNKVEKSDLFQVMIANNCSNNNYFDEDDEPSLAKNEESHFRQ